MTQLDPELEEVLRSDLHHRSRPMTGRDPRERGRSATPLELLYDLTYVVAFAAAAEQLAELIIEGHAGPGVGAYLFAVFAITWAWLNFTWFSSAYGNDDAWFRAATIVQMVGVIILIFGLHVSFAAAAEAESPNNLVMVLGYLVMRVPQIALWWRAARHDPGRRPISIAYAIAIAAAQTGWILSALLPLPVTVTVVALVALALAEMVAPVVIESKLGRPPWNASHIAERFSLLTLITLGEVIAATTAAVGALLQDEGWSVGAIVVAASGLVLAASLWWAYFLIPSGPILQRWPERTYLWRYAHLPMFGSIAAVGAGLRVSAAAVEDGRPVPVAGRAQPGHPGGLRARHHFPHLERADARVRPHPCAALRPVPAAAGRGRRGRGRRRGGNRPGRQHDRVGHRRGLGGARRHHRGRRPRAGRIATHAASPWSRPEPVAQGDQLRIRT